MYGYEYIPMKIRESCERFPDKIAYSYGDESITYSELLLKAMPLAEYLSGGTSPVVICGHRSPLFIISIFACLLCGRAYVPCDISIPFERINAIASASKSQTMLCTEDMEYSFELRDIVNKSMLEKIMGSNISFGCADCGDERAYIVFTSGSTGAPKGIPISRECLANFIGFALPLMTGEQWAGHALFSFDLSVADIYIPLISGGTLREIEAHEWGDYSVLCCTPSFLRLCLCGSAFGRDRLKRLERVICCGEVMPAKTARLFMERFPEVQLINAYGPAECCCFVTYHTVTAADVESGDIPVGDMDCCDCRVEIRNGEIFLGGSFADCYIDGSKGGFADGGYYTGDGGDISDGLIRFSRRLDERMIKYSGYRIELGEIEKEISMLEGINGCVCVPVYSKEGAVMRLAAHVACEDGMRLDAAHIKRQLKSRLPVYMIPAVIEQTGQLPMTPNGKCDRRGFCERERDF